MKLHYSQTVNTAKALKKEVLIPYEITLLSNSFESWLDSNEF